jgi:hypothetical protein
MHLNKRTVLAALAVAALAVPAAAGAKPGGGKGHGKPAAKEKQSKKVMFVFRGTFTAPGTVAVDAGNAHVRKGGFVGQAVTFDFADAKVVVADTNGDLVRDVADVKDGDRVLVTARVARRTKFAEGAEAVVARKLVDKAKAPVEGDEAAPVEDEETAPVAEEETGA